MLQREYRDSKGANVALLRSLAISLITKGSVKTTEARAKKAKRFVENLISKAKGDNLAARRYVLAELGGNREVSSALFSRVTPLFKGRASGFTRVIRIGRRRGDAALLVKLELVESFKKKKEVVSEEKQVEKTKEVEKVEKKAKPKKNE